MVDRPRLGHGRDGAARPSGSCPGYVMALFLAGFRGIPHELREAAVVDGASTYQLYRHVLFPQLTPVALSALIITGHMSMKMFDLIMSVSGPQYLTEVPAVYVWQTLLTSDYAKAAADLGDPAAARGGVIVPVPRPHQPGGEAGHDAPQRHAARPAPGQAPDRPPASACRGRPPRSWPAPCATPADLLRSSWC